LKLVNKKIQISCDGGGATGKSTGAKMIAKKYKLKFLSSGLLYRYAAFLLIKYKPKNQIVFLKRKFKNLNYEKLNKISLHTSEISKKTSNIAKINNVRKILKTFQTKFANKFKNCCIEGRDISTKILPNSDIKFFFKCNLNTAALRRWKELKKTDNKIKFKDVKKALRIRNNHDAKRRFSPLLKHRDAIEIDTSKLNKQAMLAKMSKHIDKVIKKKYGD
jgi:cytidylate kinase